MWLAAKVRLLAPASAHLPESSSREKMALPQRNKGDVSQWERAGAFSGSFM